MGLSGKLGLRQGPFLSQLYEGNRRAWGRCLNCEHLQLLLDGCPCKVCGVSNNLSLDALGTSSQGPSSPPSWSNGGGSSVEGSLAPGGREAKTAKASGKTSPLEPPNNDYLDPVTFNFLADEPGVTQAVERAKKSLGDSWVSEEWRKLLTERLGPDDAVKINGCLAGIVWRMKECASCGRTQAVPISRCESRYCPECEAIRSRWKAMDAYRRIKCFGTKEDDVGAFPHLEFTAPEDKYRYLAVKEHIDRWMEVVRNSLREWYGVLNRKNGGRGWYKDGDIGGLQAFHSWASNDDFPELHPHIPVLLAGWLVRDGGKVRIKLQRKKWEIHRLRRIYTRRMCEAFAWNKEEIPSDKQGNRLLVVFYNHTWAGGERGEASLIRCLTYMLRAPSPQRRKQGWASLEGLDEDGLKKVLGHYMLRRQVRVLRWFGFLSGREYKKLCEDFGMDPLDWKEKPDYDSCPYCGGVLRDTGEIVVTPIGSGPPQMVYLGRAPP